MIDEADRMLDMGFIPDVRRIVYKTPHKRERQTLFFSATFNDDVMRLATSWTLDPVHVAIEPENVAVDSVEQKFWLVSAENKGKLLAEMVEAKALSRVMVFANRRDSTRNLHEYLRRKNVSCEMLSGEVPQRKRLTTLDRFKQGKIRVLVATDVAGRGIHVDDVSARHQLRSAGRSGRLRPPHRSHRSRRRQRHFDQLHLGRRRVQPARARRVPRPSGRLHAAGAIAPSTGVDRPYLNVEHDTPDTSLDYS